MGGHDVIARSIRIHGVVQGVGFRMFVHRIALTHALAGWVLNAGDDVEIHVEGDQAPMDDFLRDLRATAPPAAVIRSIDVSETAPVGASGFEIRRSRAR